MGVYQKQSTKQFIPPRLTKKTAKKVAIERAGILFVFIGQKILGVGFWFQCVQNNAAPPFLYSRGGCLPQQRQRLLGFNKL
jgi:hypothetical protein